MRIMQVEKTLVSTNRIKEMGHRPLLVVRDKVGGT
ncbi:MAG: carboxysome peptide A, partial [Hydrogenophilales bacterium 17-61-9]